MSASHVRPAGSSQGTGHESEREFICADTIVVDFKLQRVELFNATNAAKEVLATLQRNKAPGARWRRAVLGAVFWLREPSRGHALDQEDSDPRARFLEAFLEVAQEAIPARRELPPEIVQAIAAERMRAGVPPAEIEAGLAHFARPDGDPSVKELRHQILRRMLKLRDDERRSWLPRGHSADKGPTRSLDPEVLLERQRRRQRLERLLDDLSKSAPAPVQRVIERMRAEALNIAEACRAEGVSRATFEAWVNRTQRRLGVQHVKKVKSHQVRRPKTA
jgi:hypothetical protein